jgi:hypothetical protein
MSVFAIMMVKDEVDILEATIQHCLTQGVEHFVISDNLSSDGTTGLLATLAGDMPGMFTVFEDPEVGYYQSRKMTELARRAGNLGADWIVPVDADEFWYTPNPQLTIREALGLSPNDIECAYSFEQYGPWRATEPKRLAKVAFRYRPGCMLAQGNHDVLGAGTSRGWHLLEIREYQYRTVEQTIRKVRNGKVAYDATDLHPMEGAHWREMGQWSDSELTEWWERHTASLSLWDPPPWKSPFPTTAKQHSSPTA